MVAGCCDDVAAEMREGDARKFTQILTHFAQYSTCCRPTRARFISGRRPRLVGGCGGARHPRGARQPAQSLSLCLLLHRLLEHLELRRDVLGRRPPVLAVEVALRARRDVCAHRRDAVDDHLAVVAGLGRHLRVREDLLDERGGLRPLLVAAVSAVPCAAGEVREAARWNCASAGSVHAPYETLKVKGAWPLCFGDSVDACLEGALTPDC